MAGIEPGTYVLITQGRQRSIWAKQPKRARCVGSPRTEYAGLHSRHVHHSDIGLGRVILLEKPNARVSGDSTLNQDCHGFVQQPLIWLMSSVKAEENQKAKNNRVGRVDSNSVPALQQVRRAEAK